MFDEQPDGDQHGECAAEIHRLQAEIAACAAALPGTRYMDPPDGGSVTIAEQVARMAKENELLRKDLEFVTEARILDAKDAELINWLETEMYDLRCISVPTGGDDYCEHWAVISHHMAKPNERTEGYGKTPREAITASMQAEGKS